jgi:hypothetical protein
MDGGELRFAPSAPMAVLVGWAFGPFLLGWAISLITVPILHGRYLIGSLPALIAIASVGIARFTATTARLLVAVAATAIVASIGLTSESPRPREDWRSAGKYISERLAPTDCVVVTTATRALKYYVREPFDCLINSSMTANLGPDAVQSELAFLVFVENRGRSIDAVRSDLIKAFPAERWKALDRASFNRINVVVLARR